MTIEELQRLFAEFPRESVHWRAQSMKKDGSAAMALAYIDARDVMDRLDLICGPENWQDSYTETAKGRVICTLTIRIGEEWIAKSDGAGDTAVEGDKGGISDAFKRAAVKWGVGRYLYDMPTPWVPCESYESNGKKVWKGWKQSPWDFIRAPQKDPPAKELIATLAKAAGITLQTITESYNVKSLDQLSDAQSEAVIKRLNLTIQDKAKEVA
jgi:hypothetical protein